MFKVYVYDPHNQEYLEGSYTVARRPHVDEMTLELGIPELDRFEEVPVRYWVFYDPTKDHAFRILKSDQIHTKYVGGTKAHINMYMNEIAVCDTPIPFRQ